MEDKKSKSNYSTPLILKDFKIKNRRSEFSDTDDCC